ncbi:carbon storage regulator [Cognatiluteimonas weifangensis]|uniref:Translational regulator CsrA n=1 Tax=Cognatiluteimonas weifangensis TaxID=2303539 RepID=A0A372DKI0_9GAMM|nr:carbon storage regulator [Luteimonas weifangensis]
MLLLTRKSGRALVIGGDVTVTVVSVEGGRVVLGVQAPRAVAVRRDDARKVPRRASEARSTL